MHSYYNKLYQEDVFIENYKIIKPIGIGKTSNVFLATNHNN